MNKEDLRELLHQEYNPDNWKKVTQYVFPNVSYLQRPQDIPFNNDKVESFKQIGSVKLNDGKNLAMFEVKVSPNVNIANNRVELRNLVTPLIDQERNHGVLVIYEQGKEDYRFTFTAKSTEFDENTGDFVNRETHAKRFTYVLGKNESCKTAANRFYELSNKKEIADINTVQEAFSVEKLSKQFFKEYKEHYQKFVAYLMETINYRDAIFKGDDKAIRDFVKLLLGRLVFIQFVQKKRWMGVPSTSLGWENGQTDFLYSGFKKFPNKALFYSQFLEPLFYETLNNPNRPNNIFQITGTKVPYLNGGLFENGKTNTSLVNFPEVYFNDLLEFFDRYNFTINEYDPAEHEVGIDPEMLGHIFENLLEDNKDKGAFYTPKEIVHYMCQESLKEYLKTYLNEKSIAESSELDNALEAFVKRKEAANVIEYDEHLATALRDVKICDPAIGSGAFPMGLLNEIYHCVYVLYNASPDVVGDIWGMNTWAPDVVKKNIIQNSIYGVDIEKGAVDIARLRFWLSLIIDEPEPHALPNLDYKIVVGNSLVSKLGDEIIDIDWSIKGAIQGEIFGNESALVRKSLLKSISREQKEFFNPECNKKKLAEDIRGLKIDLLIAQFEQMVKAANLEHEPKSGNFADSKKFAKAMEHYLKTLGWKDTISKLKKLKSKPDQPLNFFDWKLDFPEVMNESVANKVGFDIVIGNPPYVQMQKNGGQLATELKNKNYSTFERTGDLYSIFYELGFQLLKPKGVHTFITSSQWMKANYGTSLRNLFLTKNPLKLIALGPGVFESAVVDTNILIAKNEVYNKVLSGAIIAKAKELEGIIAQKFTSMPYVSEDKWAILDGSKKGLSEKLNTNGKTLKNWGLNIYRGILTGFNEAFIIDEAKKEKLINEDAKSKEIIKPILRGREIEKYYTEWDGGYLINTHNGIKSKKIEKVEINKYQSVKKHLDGFKEKLSSRQDQGDTYYNLRNCAYINEFKKEKIIWKRIGSQLRFSYSNEEIFSLDSTCIATGEKIKYLTGLLNSKLCNYLMFESAPKTGMGDLIISVQALEPIPVFYPNEQQELLIVNIVDKIIDNKSQGKDTTALEQQIDNLVYHLYDLTYDEVKVVDPEFGLSEEEYNNIKIE